ncbi:MAG: LLM class flavin-dependent oxidoreductase [Solirubrobacteraceae bacterium]
MRSKRKSDVALFWMPEWGGFHVAGWRAADAPDDPTLNFAEIRRMVQRAEAAKLHACFLADALAVGFQGIEVSNEALSRTARGTKFEPITLMSALSACTEHIGLLCTASTTYNEPFHVARMFASLDHLSGGRAGWNAVTSKAESVNFGGKQMGHGQRYERAQEFVEIVRGLWNSWDDDAFIRDRDSGKYFDPEKLHSLDYAGQYLSVAGPLHIARPVQGHPVVAQAGASAEGRAFAARNADVIYTLQSDLGTAKAFYADVKEQSASFGRDPEHLKVLPAQLLLIGRSDAHAEEKLARLDSLVDPRLGMESLTSLIETDLSAYPLDGPVPEVPETQTGSKSRQRYWLDIAKRDGLTVRQLMQVASRAGVVAGSAQSIADTIHEWFEAGAADGFNISFGDATDSFDIFVNEVVPDLQQRGIFRTEYSGSTLRENLGLPRPADRSRRAAPTRD